MSDEPRTGIPVLSGVSPMGNVLPGEPIMYFDRNQETEDDTPYARLKYRLEQRRWRADMIEPFLDRLGFKP